MAEQPDHLDDATLEYAAQLIEEADFLDLAGTLSKRKRVREDADLRMHTRIELKKEMAKHLRAMKSRRDLDAPAVLARVVADCDRSRHGMHLTDAWPLAWKGWINIYATVRCNSNCVPPETEYRVELTERGRAVLEQYHATEAATTPAT